MEKLLTGFSRFFRKHIIDDCSGNKNQSKSYLSLGKILCKVDHNSSNNSSALMARYQNIIARIKFPINVKKSRVNAIAANQATLKFVNIAEIVFNFGLVGSKKNLIISNYQFTK